MSFKVLFWKLQSIKYYGTLCRYSLCHSVAILWEIYETAWMSCDVATLPFQAHSNYGTWSIGFGQNSKFISIFVIKQPMIKYKDKSCPWDIGKARIL